MPTKLKPSQHWRRWRAGVFNVQYWLNNEACQVIELGCRGVASEVVKKEEEQVLKEEAKEEAKEEEQVAKGGGIRGRCGSASERGVRGAG